MVELKVLTLIVAGPDSPSFLVMQPQESPVSEGKHRVIPIAIGPNEAMAIGVVIEGARFPRPMTHDLMLDAFTNLDARIDHVLISDIRQGTFYARLYLKQHGRLIDLDARPSDAIALALRQSCPIYVDDDVLNRASFPYLFNKEVDEESVVSDFKQFLEGISPDDFS